VNLRVPREWRVGRVWLRRPEWLLARIEATRAAPGTTHTEALERLAVEVRELPWVLAVAEAATDEEARAIVEEHIAVLRLYQRFRYRYVSLDRQTFGLPETIRRIWETFYVLESDIVIGAGFTQSGVLGAWEFKIEDLDAWPEDAAFAYFEDLLRKEPGKRSDTENRLITALGIASVSTVSLRAPLRHVLYAVALEALLGNPPPAERTHRIAVRAAFLTCDLLGPEPRGRHGPERPACPILAYATRKEMRKKVREMFPNGSPICSYYEWIHNVTTQRNTVLHEGLRGGDHRTAAGAEGRVDEVILEYARMAAHVPLTSLADLDAEIRRVVEANPKLADGTFGRPVGGKTKPLAREANV
jgi:hypothetical protein